MYLDIIEGKSVQELMKLSESCYQEQLVAEEAREMSIQRVVCAANRIIRYFYINNEQFNTELVVLGARHFDALMHSAISNISTNPFDKIKPSDWEQGFIDQRGNFLTREEAWIVAETAGQIIQRVGGDEKKLFSENLY